MRSFLAIPALLFVLAPIAASAEPDEIAAGIDRLVKPLVDGGVVHGMTVGVIRGDESRRFSYGELPAGPDSVFEIGSITKVFTA